MYFDQKPQQSTTHQIAETECKFTVSKWRFLIYWKWLFKFIFLISASGWELEDNSIYSTYRISRHLLFDSFIWDRDKKLEPYHTDYTHIRLCCVWRGQWFYTSAVYWCQQSPNEYTHCSSYLFLMKERLWIIVIRPKVYPIVVPHCGMFYIIPWCFDAVF